MHILFLHMDQLFIITLQIQYSTVKPMMKDHLSFKNTFSGIFPLCFHANEPFLQNLRQFFSENSPLLISMKVPLTKDHPSVNTVFFFLRRLSLHISI